MAISEGNRRARIIALLAIGGGAAAQVQACDVLATGPRREAGAEHPLPVGAAPGDSVREAADRHAGTFDFAGGEAERDAVLAAIDDVVGEMNPIARPIARERLRQANRVPERIEIARTGDVVAIAFDDRRYEAPLDGSPVEVVGVTGDTLTYRLSVRPQHVQQMFSGDKGDRENTLGLQGERGLALRVRISSDNLPKPLVYRLSYRRS